MLHAWHTWPNCCLSLPSESKDLFFFWLLLLPELVVGSCRRVCFEDAMFKDPFAWGAELEETWTNGCWFSSKDVQILLIDLSTACSPGRNLKQEGDLQKPWAKQQLLFIIWQCLIILKFPQSFNNGFLQRFRIFNLDLCVNIVVPEFFQNVDQMRSQLEAIPLQQIKNFYFVTHFPEMTLNFVSWNSSTHQLFISNANNKWNT